MARVLLILSFVAGISFSQNLAAQDIDPNNLKNLNVDQLTDVQISKFLDQVEANGYTEEQLFVLAKARGMSEGQVQKLKKRIDQYRNKREGKQDDNSVERLRNKPNISERKSLSYDPFDLIVPEDTVEDKYELPIFGLSFFNNEKLTFEPSLNVPTPENYQLGSGDEMIIDIWGASEQNYQLTISPEGSIRIPSIGPIYVNGLTMKEATSRIKYRLKSIYSTLGNNTFADVSLGQVRTIKVNIVGEVKLPGTYAVTSFTSAFNALYVAGGPTKTGSLRKIDVFRQGKKVGTLDGYGYLIKGDATPITLKEQDVIVVNPYQNRVKARGQVKRPAIYETVPGETMKDLIEYFGGFTEIAFSGELSVRRNKGSYKTMESVSEGELDSFELKNGDEVEVKAISNIYLNRVTIEGAVLQPGEYALSPGLTLKQLIQDANGLRGDAFLPRAVVLRQESDFSLKSISVDLREVVRGNNDFIINEGDLITISSIYDLRENYTVRIEGEVLKPGNYPFAKAQSVEDLIYLAGGFKESAAKSFVEVARRLNPDSVTDNSKTAEIYNFPISKDLSISSESSSFQLKPFDLVVIRRSPYYEGQMLIEIEGEVKYPGKYSLQSKDEKISDVIRRSGGLTEYAYPQGATLIRRTEYFVSESDDAATSVAARIRREELMNLLDRDTLIENSQAKLKQQEAIGIKLVNIIDDPGSEFDLVLKEGDVISIPKELQTVRIRGEVLYPSNVRFDRSVGFKNYIGRAGGFTDEARIKRAYVIYANGSAERTKSFLWFKNFPYIEPGSEIIIPKKPEKRKLSPGEVLGITSGLASMSLIIVQIINILR